MDGKRPVVPVVVDVEVEGPCIEGRSYGFLDLKALFFLLVRFISLMHVDDQGEGLIDYISGANRFVLC